MSFRIAASGMVVPDPWKASYLPFLHSIYYLQFQLVQVSLDLSAVPILDTLL